MSLDSIHVVDHVQLNIMHYWYNLPLVILNKRSLLFLWEGNPANYSTLKSIRKDEQNQDLKP